MTSWLLGTLLAASGLIVLVLLAREPVRRRFGSRIAYGLWLIPAARLLMPTLTETVERPAAAGASLQPLVDTSAEGAMMMAQVPAEPVSLIAQAGGWPTVLLTIWLGVAAGLFVSRMAAFRRDRRAILGNATQVARIGSIRLVRSPEVTSPLAFGIVDRVIAVPADFDRLYDERERALALDHELAHHRSGDLVANLFAFVLLCLQWFNPLAWVAHAAFRFDQEAACDARVLDKAKARDRADYGRAIAKAASGRALLFASALDHRNTLHRRLKSMMTNPTGSSRSTGKFLILAAVALALPLTATRAVDYIDVPAPTPPPAPKAPPAPAVPAALAAQTAAPIAPIAPIPPVPPVAPVHGAISINDDHVTINGKTKRLSELTPAERQEIRGEIARAKAELARTRIDRAEIDREIREALAEVRVDRDELRRDLAEARVEIERAVREVDANAAEIRRSGQDPEMIKAQVRASLKAVEAIDVEAITRRALAAVDPATIAASVAAAEASIARAQAEMDRLESRIEQAGERAGKEKD